MASAIRIVCVLLLAFFTLLEPHAIFAFGKKQETPIETKVVTDLQDKYDSMAAPGMIMLPVYATSAVPLDFLAEIEKELYKQLVNTGRTKPVKMQHWLLTTYNNKANNPFAIMDAIKSEQFIIPLHYIGRPFVFRSGNQYYFALYAYSLETYYPTIVFRKFASLDSIENLISSCIQELQLRLFQPAHMNTKKRIVIDEFKLEFFRLAVLPSGEFEFISAPFYDDDGITFRDGDDFFSRIMGYILVTTDMFQTMQISDFKEHSNAIIGNTTNFADYRLQGRVQLTEYECVLYIDLIDLSTGGRTVSLRHPLVSYTFEGVWNAYRELSLQIIAKLYSEENYGIIPVLESPGRSFFANDMFVGWDNLVNYVLPKGLHIISTGSEYGIESEENFVNTYHVLLDYQGVVFTDDEGKHIWNLLKK